MYALCNPYVHGYIQTRYVGSLACDEIVGRTDGGQFLASEASRRISLGGGSATRAKLRAGP